MKILLIVAVAFLSACASIFPARQFGCHGCSADFASCAAEYGSAEAQSWLELNQKLCAKQGALNDSTDVLK